MRGSLPCRYWRAGIFSRAAYQLKESEKSAAEGFTLSIYTYLYIYTYVYIYIHIYIQGLPPLPPAPGIRSKERSGSLRILLNKESPEQGLVEYLRNNN